MPKIRTDELFLYTPHPGSYSTKLTLKEINEKVFYENVYTLPYFEQDISQTFEQEMIEAARKKKEKFEDELNSSHGVESTFNIIGYCGSGKSVYLGKLLYEFKQNNNNIIIKYDFATIGAYENQSFILFGNDWINRYTPANTLSYFVSLLLLELDKKIRDTINNKKLLESYIKFYEKILKPKFYAEYKDFFNILKEYSSEKIDSTEFYNEKMKEYFDYLIFDYPNAYDVIKKLLRLRFLLATAERKYIHKSKGVIYIAIDSLEHFLKGNNFQIRIFNKDIKDLYNLLNDFITNLKHSVIFADSPQEVYDSFRILMACRETSDNMLRTDNVDSEDEENFTINMSEWFQATDILHDRLEFYEKHLQENYELEDRDTVGEALKQIFKDEELDRSLYNRLHEMYNHNYRRMIEFLVEVLTKNNLYNEYLEITNNNDTNLKAIYTRGARQMIIGSLLRLVADTGFFRRIYVTEENGALYHSSYARKILTYLYRKYPTDNLLNDEREHYVEFSEILKVFKKFNNADITDQDIENISKVLENLNDSSKEHNKWCQHLIIRYNDENFTLDDLMRKLIEIRDGVENDTNKFTLKITNAGRFFLANMCQFEYYAARYAPNFMPLFCKSNLQKENGVFKCIQLIKTVRKHTFDLTDAIKNEKAKGCLDILYNREERFFSNDVNGEKWINMYSSEDENKFYLYKHKDSEIEFPHPERTLEAHISYLSDYRNYIIFLKNLDNTEKRSISESILAVILQYVNKLEWFYELKDSKGWYYCGGKRSFSESRYNVDIYRKRISQAKKNLLEIVHINRDRG